MNNSSHHQKTDSGSGGNQPHTSFDLLSFYFAVREKAWLVLICVLLAGVGGWFYTQKAERIFAANVVLQVDQTEDTILKIDKVAQDELRGQEILNTIAQNLKNPVLFERVILTNGL